MWLLFCLPACPRPAAPPGFSGVVSGQRGPKTGASNATLGPGMHTAASSVFGPPAHPTSPTSLDVLLQTQGLLTKVAQQFQGGMDGGDSWNRR